MSSTQEYIEIVSEIESEMVFSMDYFTIATKKQKEQMEVEISDLANRLIEKVENSKIPKEQKLELIETIYQRLDDPQIDKI